MSYDDIIEGGITALQRGDIRRLFNLLQRAEQMNPERFEAKYLGYWAYRHIGNSDQAKKLSAWSRAIPFQNHFYSIMKAKLPKNTHEISVHIGALKQYMAPFLKAETFILSYPKCGRTWLRLMLGHYLSGDEFLNVGKHSDLFLITRDIENVATTSVDHDDYPHWKIADDIEENKDFYQDRNILFLVRDPRDVVISQFFQVKCPASAPMEHIRVIA